MSIEQVLAGGLFLLFYGTGLWMLFTVFVYIVAAAYLLIRDWGKPEPEGGYATLSEEGEEEEDEDDF